ncbi:hypothetical protein LVJ85_08275 [Neisseria sp. Dent CA1/247]|uniref:hypothetical protein n=1 Tax=Neisseria sp. Dent CA1/247 TaxID=2912675 RepID=UPI001FD02CAB|nr:hypothetical protein [Neisseria sp. Dent CA1/247]UOO76043.1 hypothetical protein LVJ85_08275 [Neisseria sp. Dent CA1/247]
MDNRQTHQLNDIYDELMGSRKAFEGVQALLAGSNSSKVDTEMLSQLIGTCNNRLKDVEARFSGIIRS